MTHIWQFVPSYITVEPFYMLNHLVFSYISPILPNHLLICLQSSMLSGNDNIGPSSTMKWADFTHNYAMLKQSKPK